jgi:hypothetical protein
LNHIDCFYVKVEVTKELNRIIRMHLPIPIVYRCGLQTFVGNLQTPEIQQFLFTKFHDDDDDEVEPMPD